MYTIVPPHKSDVLQLLTTAQNKSCILCFYSPSSAFFCRMASSSPEYIDARGGNFTSIGHDQINTTIDHPIVHINIFPPISSASSTSTRQQLHHLLNVNDILPLSFVPSKRSIFAPVFDAEDSSDGDVAICLIIKIVQSLMDQGRSDHYQDLKQELDSLHKTLILAGLAILAYTARTKPGRFYQPRSQVVLWGVARNGQHDKWLSAGSQIYTYKLLLGSSLLGRIWIGQTSFTESAAVLRSKNIIYLFKSTEFVSSIFSEHAASVWSTLNEKCFLGGARQWITNRSHSSQRLSWPLESRLFLPAPHSSE